MWNNNNNKPNAFCTSCLDVMCCDNKLRSNTNMLCIRRHLCASFWESLLPNVCSSKRRSYAPQSNHDCVLNNLSVSVCLSVCLCLSLSLCLCLCLSLSLSLSFSLSVSLCLCLSLSLSPFQALLFHFSLLFHSFKDSSFRELVLVSLANKINFYYLKEHYLLSQSTNTLCFVIINYCTALRLHQTT